MLKNPRKEYRKTIHGLFGSPIYCHALFYNYPGGLRFALSEGGSPLDQILTALNKAAPICRAVFADDECMLVHLQGWRGTGKEWRKVLRELQEAGITIPRDREIWLEKEEDEDGETFYWTNIAFDIPVSKLQNLLWCALTVDFPSLRPNPGCRVYLIDPKKGLIVHPYDDRGMDIVGATEAKPLLEALYREFHHCLLEYDIDAMNETFSRQ